MRVKRRHLEVFHALMEAGSVSRAAERLNLTQPAVSLALSAFEKELGFPLFHRTKGYFAPTGEAQALHAETEVGLLALTRIERRAAEISSGRVGSISIASNGAVAINLLPWLIADFQKYYPEIYVDLKIRSSRQIAMFASGRQVDIGLIDAPVPVAGLDTTIFKLPCVCVFQEGDPLGKEAVIRPEMLAGRSIIAITGDHTVDKEVDSLAAEAGVRIERRVSCSYFAIARNLVRAGAGIALIDAINGTRKLDDGTDWRPFEPRIHFELALITPSGQPMEAAASTFYTALVKYLSACAEFAEPGDLGELFNTDGER
ncbi:LysR family transcriptional regulator [Hwanghaeella grinnelliae]|uniref:LysR family transcriptional regulator n=1 Tax=Hwanghaeella grinnelliae TaxID=2500179 RepID=A0A437QMV0_9PROT|nr:LysR substrate-binding domain-containing protein [Hwanghaeella grinnelliae]RVU35832.1 LysR family transcriptional regulator [Hwanghaeella grinnelliae]